MNRRILANRARITHILGAGIVIGLLTGAPASGATASCGGANGSNGVDINVTSIMADSDVNNLTFQFQSDGLGPYVTYNASKTDSVFSVIQANSCDWVLAMSSLASR